MSPDENWYNFLLLPKTTTATSTEHRTPSSYAFLNRPALRFKNVLFCVSEQGACDGVAAYTERLRSSLMGLISILRLPIVKGDCPTTATTMAVVRTTTMVCIRVFLPVEVVFTDVG